MQIKLSNWQEVELGNRDYFELRKGESITRSKVTDGNIPVIAGGQDLAYYHNTSNRKGETITVSASGAYAGFVNYFNTPIFASDCSTIQSRDKNIASTRYVYLFLKSKQNFIYRLQKGVAQPHVYPKDLAEIKIPLPPIEIQKKIVSILEKAESLKQKREMADKLTQEYLKSVFYEMFLDKKFPLELLENLTSWITQGPNPDLKSGKINEKYGFIKTKDVYDNKIHYDKINPISEEEFNKYFKYELLDKDVLLAIVGFGSIGKINIYRKNGKRVIPTRALALIRPKKDKLNPFYLRAYFLSSHGKKIVENWIGGSTGQLVVRTSVIKEHKIPLPPIELQNKFAKIVEHVEEMKEKQLKNKEYIGEMFNSLMQKAFNGELIQ